MSDAPPTLRDALREAEPRDFAVKEAWTQVIHALRQRYRETGERGWLSSRQAVDRALDLPCLGDAGELKALLRELVRGEGKGEVAARIDAAVARLVPATRREPVPVQVTGWPPDFGDWERRRLTGADDLSAVDPTLAAGLRRLDGLSLAGQTLRVSVQLPAGEVLPPPPAGYKPRKPPLWLRHLDDEGRLSLTPQAIAQRQARRLPAEHVVDAFCGCGGNAIAFAQAGARVTAIENNRVRASLARMNIREQGVEDRVQVIVGDARQLLPRLLGDGAALFLDPPWGGSDWERAGMSWTDLGLDGLHLAGCTLVKLPRAFDVATAPGRWRVCYEFGEARTGDERVVKMLSLLRTE